MKQLEMQAWHHGWASAVLRVLKPGAHLLAFGGTRTYHRLACAIEDAGFEVRDCLMYVYGQGFPKSLDVAYALHKDAEQAAQRDVRFVRTTHLSSPVHALFPTVKGGTWNRTDGARHFNNNGDDTGYETAGRDETVGSAARFFYCAKASRAERERGLDGFEGRVVNEGTPPGTAGSNSPRCGAGRSGPRKNHHPTVKPVALMRYLVRLVTPPGGLVLDPFLGSGTTLVAAKLEGVRGVGIEREAEYVDIARARVAAHEEPIDA
jgi:site-specific DNA-methyltransferase (adenine-specific)